MSYYVKKNLANVKGHISAEAKTSEQYFFLTKNIYVTVSHENQEYITFNWASFTTEEQKPNCPLFYLFFMIQASVRFFAHVTSGPT